MRETELVLFLVVNAKYTILLCIPICLQWLLLTLVSTLLIYFSS